MRKFIISILFTLACITAFGQGKVSTRKYILEDFTDKVTKVVIPEGDILASALKQEVVNTWNASAFEFCSPKEFESLKTSDEYYFLMITANTFKGETEPGILFLTLFKGGNGADENLAAMHEVISLPVAPADETTGRELVYIGAIVNSIQAYTLAAMESEKTAYIPDKWFNDNFAHRGHMMTIYMAEEDVSVSVKDSELEKYIDEDFHICSADEADDKFMNPSINTLVSYCIAPAEPEPGSYSYQLLLRADTLELYYIVKHKIKHKAKAGFLSKDLKWLAGKR